MPCKKKITKEMFIEAKANFPKMIWELADVRKDLPQRQQRFAKGASRPEIELKCSGCCKLHWIAWHQIKTGKSRACSFCFRAPDLTLLPALKEKFGFHWTWSEGSSPETRWRSTVKAGKTVQVRDVRLLCKCGKWHWTLWSNLKAGRSKGCFDCYHALPSLKEMFEIKKKNGALLTPLGESAVVKGYRHIKVKCDVGGEVLWVHWGNYRSGHKKRCTNKDCYKSRSNLYQNWRNLLARNKTNIVPEWRTYEKFSVWAKELYSPGWRLTLIDKTKPYGPDNCDYIPMKREAPVVPEAIVLKKKPRTPDEEVPDLPFGLTG